MLMQIFVFFIYRFIVDIFLSSGRNIITLKNYRVHAQILGMIYVGKVTQRSCLLVSLLLFKTIFVDFKNDMHMNVLSACIHLPAPYTCLLLLNVRRGCLSGPLEVELWEPNTGPLQEQKVLVIIEPFLQSQYLISQLKTAHCGYWTCLEKSEF